MADNKNRVVITSIGLVSPIGIGVEEFWNNLINGKSGLKDIQSFDTSEFTCKKAYEIQDFHPEEYLGKKGLRNLDRITQFLLVTASLALKGRNDVADIGVVLGTAFGGLHSIYDFEKTALRNSYYSLNPLYFANTVLNAPASYINIRFGMTKLSETICTGICSGIDAVGIAYNYVKNGYYKTILCGGADELNIELFTGMYLKEKLLKSANIVNDVCIPFLKNRNGIVLGEGVCLFIVESLEKAVENNRKVLAEIIGYGTNFNAHKDFNEDIIIQDSVKAINRVLNNAGIKAEQIDYICADANDNIFEVKILKKVFAQNLNKISLNSIKSNVGESFGASSAMQVACSIKAMSENIVPLTTDIYYSKNSCEQINILKEKISKQINMCLVSSIGNIRLNSCLMLKKFD